MHIVIRVCNTAYKCLMVLVNQSTMTAIVEKHKWKWGYWPQADIFYLRKESYVKGCILVRSLWKTSHGNSEREKMMTCYTNHRTTRLSLDYDERHKSCTSSVRSGDYKLHNHSKNGFLWVFFHWRNNIFYVFKNSYVQWHKNMLWIVQDENQVTKTMYGWFQFRCKRDWKKIHQNSFLWLVWLQMVFTFWIFKIFYNKLSSIGGRSYFL